ncbi:DUF4349 domain-containing protein [Metabacillus sp. HB246100]
MYRWIIIFSITVMLAILGACSSEQQESQEDMAITSSHDNVGSEGVEKEIERAEESLEEGKQQSETNPAPEIQQSARKVIYTANMMIEVENYQQSLDFIEKQVTNKNGFIVESNSYAMDDDDRAQGTLTVRVPQETFQSFLQEVENGSSKVVEKSLTGQDVTEEFVDLESRLTSKEVVEKRLIQFMEKAEKTEDLLKISTDLATVQEEIEQIKGRMSFLENRVDLATVTIHLREIQVKIPGLENKDLNTWERTQKVFMDSVNFLIIIASGLFVWLVGSLPILLIVGMMIAVVSIFIKRRRKQQQQINHLNHPNEPED